MQAKVIIQGRHAVFAMPLLHPPSGFTGILRAVQVSGALNPESGEGSKAFQECVLARHPRHGEFAIAFITGRTVLQVRGGWAGGRGQGAGQDGGQGSRLQAASEIDNMEVAAAAAGHVLHAACRLCCLDVAVRTAWP
jgi:hypothetical protein